MYESNTQVLLDELNKRGIEYEFIDEKTRLLEVRFPGQKPLLVQRTHSKFVSSLGFQIAKRKDLTYRILDKTVVNIPKTLEYAEDKVVMSEIEAMLERSPLVVKPEDGAHGRGITTDIIDLTRLKAAVERARVHSETTLVQEQVVGQDVRILFIGDEFAGALVRHPASVVGDGTSTVGELIDLENTNPNRGEKYQKDLNYINVESAKNYLGSRIGAIPESGESFRVMGVANVGQGGTAEDITSRIDSGLVEVASIAKRHCSLTHAGVDFMVPDPIKPISMQNPASFIEINGSPLLAFHLRPQIGESQPVVAMYVDWLIAQNS